MEALLSSRIEFFLAIFVITIIMNNTFIYYLSHAPPNGRVRHKAFLSGSRHRAVVQTRLAREKNVTGHSSKKERLRRQKINLVPPKSVKSLGDGPLRLEEWVSLSRKTRLPGFLGSHVKLSRATKSHQTNSSRRLVRKGLVWGLKKH